MNRVKIKLQGKPVRWMRPGQATARDGRSYRYSDPKVEQGKREIRAEFRKKFKQPPWDGPVYFKFTAIFAVPKSWPEATKQACYEGRVHHIQDPDLDQLIKLAKDACIGLIYIDDNQVSAYLNPRKRYGYPERVEIEFGKLEQQSDEITPPQAKREKQAAQGTLGIAVPKKAVNRNTNKTISRYTLTGFGKRKS